MLKVFLRRPKHGLQMGVTLQIPASINDKVHPTGITVQSVRNRRNTALAKRFPYKNQTDNCMSPRVWILFRDMRAESICG
jgi:hypothetical protein